MITIEYCEEGRAISDFSCGEWLYNVYCSTKKTGTDHTFKVSTSLPIDFIRLAIVRGELDCKNITFLYLGNSFQANEYGAIPDWPTGFADRGTGIAEDILQTAMKKRKMNRT